VLPCTRNALPSERLDADAKTFFSDGRGRSPHGVDTALDFNDVLCNACCQQVRQHSRR